MRTVQEPVQLDYDVVFPEGFLPINCKFCDGIISAKLGSENLVCLECNSEFKIKEIVD